MSYVKSLLIAIDQLINAIFGGWPDETLSAHSWRRRDRQPFKTLQPVIDRLFFDRQHCETAFESEISRNQSPAEERK